MKKVLLISLVSLFSMSNAGLKDAVVALTKGTKAVAASVGSGFMELSKGEKIALGVTIGAITTLVTYLIIDSVNHKKNADRYQKYIKSTISNVKNLTEKKCLTFSDQEFLYNFERYVANFEQRINKLEKSKYAQYIEEAQKLIQESKQELNQFDMTNIRSEVERVRQKISDARVDYMALEYYKKRSRDRLNSFAQPASKQGYCYQCDNWYEISTHNPATCNNE